MTAISYGNYSLASTLNYQTGGRSKAGNRPARFGSYSGVSAKNAMAPWSSFSTQPAGSASETQWLGYTVENDENTCGDTWEKVDKLPGFYELKEGRPIGWIEMHPGLEYRFYHAAESTDENPVLVARGVDERGRLFEQKIDLNQINPYNATKVEISALTHVYKPEDRFIAIPFLDYFDDEDVLNTRFDYIGSLQAAISTSGRLGFRETVKNYESNIDLLLKVTKDHTTPAMAAGNRNTSDTNKIPELCISAARERFLSAMARKYSSEELSAQLLDSKDHIARI